MTIRDIALKNLVRCKGKTIFILVGLLIGVTTVVALMCLVNAMGRSFDDKLEKYGANILIVPKSEQLALTYGGLTLGGFSFDLKEIDQESLAAIETIPNAQNIAAVGPMVLGAVDVNGKKVLLAGTDFMKMQILRPWWNKKGAFPTGPNEVLAGSQAAQVFGFQAGDSLTVDGRELTVSGILDETGSQDDHILFMDLPAAQTLLGKEGRVSMVEVAALCLGCPIEKIVEQLTNALPGANVMAVKQVVQGRMDAMAHYRNFAWGLSIVVVLIGGLMVFVTMMGSVKERTVEIGIFRAIGFRRGHVMRIVFTEAALISAAAGLIGYGAGLGAAKLIFPVLTESRGFTAQFDPTLAALSFGIAVVLGLAASIYPALAASRLDPNDALRTL